MPAILELIISLGASRRGAITRCKCLNRFVWCTPSGSRFLQPTINHLTLCEFKCDVEVQREASTGGPTNMVVVNKDI